MAPLVVAAACASCAVGPDYKRPEMQLGTAYTQPAAQGDQQNIVLGGQLQADWWTLLHSGQLDALVGRALQANATIEAADAALRIAQENVAAQRAVYFPSVTAAYDFNRTRQAGAVPASSTATPANAPPSSVYSFHTAQLNIAYTPDVFGANRRSVEALLAQSDVQQMQARAARLTIASNIVGAAIQDALLRQQIALLEGMIASGQEALRIVARQWRAGAVSHLDVALQESSLGQIRQQLPPLRKQLEQNRDLLRALCGAGPTADIPAFTLDEFRLPPRLPVALPSQLVEQRPDVRAAEAQLHAAGAQIGVARAARLPAFSIGAQLGGGAMNIADLFSPGARFYSFIAGLTQPVFDAGALKHREAAARATYDQASAQYRATVLSALQNVADALHAIQQDAAALEVASANASSAGTVLDLTQRQYGHGYLDRVALLNAQQSDRQARIALLQARAARLSDTVALFQATAGRWQ